jgi:amidase
MHRDLNQLGLFEAAQAIRAGKISSTDLVQACLDRIAQREPELHAWAWLDPDAALAAARQADQQPVRGPLHGLPIAVKDIIDTTDMPTECGSPIYRGRRPSNDAACVAMARRSGAVVLGKTITTEFAYFAPGPTANPRNLAHTPGGSSSGSAAAVADTLVPAAFGTQTAASLIRPASFCGVVAYKGSFGEFSLAGIKPFAASFDTLGVITRHVIDAQWMRWAMLGIPAAEADTKAWEGTPRIGVCHTPWWQQADPDCQAVIEVAALQLARKGAKVSQATLPSHFGQLADTHKLIMAYEAAQSLCFEHDRFPDKLSPQLQSLLEDGLQISRARYLAAQQLAATARHEFQAWKIDWDILLTPSAVGTAPRGLHATGDPLFSRMWTLLGVPSVTVPGYTGQLGLPIGVQLIGDFREDDKLLAMARWVEAKLIHD